MANKNELTDKIVSLCKRRGFIYQGSEIYGGLAGFWDYAHYGLALKNNIKKLWWKRFVEDREDMYGIDAAIVMRQEAWQASGHVSGFSDPLVECKKCKSRFRADQIPKSDLGKTVCPECGGTLGEAKKFNMMFKTHVGAVEDESSVSYLRPETAQGMFVNFKNVVDSFHPKLSFGMAQIGKAFRNEIAPRDFLFRSREFEQMEIEYFVRPDEWQKSFDELKNESLAYLADLGIGNDKVHEFEVPDGERAHYSKRTIDVEYDYPFGRKELFGIAYRTDFDLKNHTEQSRVDLSYLDEGSKSRFIPHVIEPSLGVDRLVEAVLCNSYSEDEMGAAATDADTAKDKRVFLKLPPKLAPVKIAVFPLLRNKPQLVEKAREVFGMLKKEFAAVEFDDNGNIGKRYRRQDEIGTPFCVTVDFETVEKGAGVTVRDRDTGKQERVMEKDISRRCQKIMG
ncbi:glycine--tRNA ligase [Patescibacteria group bacterium]|nr:glycine--tRNA ligase [Patescibacteria group bacterium]MDE1946415.1 glycine--tRNA ligase [Patescibacteria group bacterium]MDE2011024.1 glycine--tRNA ligase [Patescibacteria group bacterium]MDE2233479.1 glycine--tRNA ligase [Patescibacteria group bacterium]